MNISNIYEINFYHLKNVLFYLTQIKLMSIFILFSVKSLQLSNSILKYLIDTYIVIDIK